MSAACTSAPARTNGALGEDFLTMRVRRRVLRQSFVGGIYTGRATRDQSAVPTRSTAGARFPAGDVDVPRQSEPRGDWLRA